MVGGLGPKNCKWMKGKSDVDLPTRPMRWLGGGGIEGSEVKWVLEGVEGLGGERVEVVEAGKSGECMEGIGVKNSKMLKDSDLDDIKEAKEGE